MISLFSITYWNICEGRETKGLLYQGKGSLLRYLTAEERNYLDDQLSFTYCADPQWMPLEWIDSGQVHQGYIADYLALVSSGLGVDFKLFPTNTWTSTLEAIKRKDCDFISAAMQTQVRDLYVNFTQPYLSYAFAITTHKDIDWSTNESYRNKTIALVEGYSYEEKLRVNYPNIKLRYVKSVREGMNLASALKVDGFVDSAMVIAFSINHYGYMNLKIAERLPEHMMLSIAVRSDDDVLLSVLNKAVQNISENEKRVIQEYWENKYATTDLIPAWVLLFSESAIILFVVVCLILFIFFRGRQKNTLALAHKKAFHEPNRRIYSRSEIQKIIIETTQQNSVGEYVPLLLKMDGSDSLADELGLTSLFEIQKQFEMQCLSLLPDDCYTGKWLNHSYLVLIPHVYWCNLVMIAEHVRYEISYNAVKQGTNMTASILIPRELDYDDLLVCVHAMSTCFAEHDENKDIVLTFPIQHRPFLPEDQVTL